jgi:hypothetical protein
MFCMVDNCCWKSAAQNLMLWLVLYIYAWLCVEYGSKFNVLEHAFVVNTAHSSPFNMFQWLIMSRLFLCVVLMYSTMCGGLLYPAV